MAFTNNMRLSSDYHKILPRHIYALTTRRDFRIDYQRTFFAKFRSGTFIITNIELLMQRPRLHLIISFYVPLHWLASLADESAISFT